MRVRVTLACLNVNKETTTLQKTKKITQTE